MTRTYSCFVLSAALACLLCSCARQAELVKLYNEGGDHEYQRLLVVGIAGDADARRALEDAFSDELRGAGAKAVPVSAISATNADLTRPMNLSPLCYRPIIAAFVMRCRRAPEYARCRA